MEERCAICNCLLHRTAGTYARPTPEGRSHATKHHFVAERFFGRSTNRRGKLTEGVFQSCPWGREGETAVFCYECHEELLHNPVLLPEDLALFASLVKQLGLSEEQKTADRSKLGGRIRLLHEALSRGLKSISQEMKEPSILNAVNAQAAALTGLLLRLQIEADLQTVDKAVPLALFETPAAKGGYLELVRAVVAETISNLAAGAGVNQANSSLAQGDAQRAAGNYKAAYASYRQAYKAAAK